MTQNKFLYESFNARYLSLEEIANSFIVNDQYEKLIMNNHSLLMGPRGSGKTTLLKMLTPASQYYWKGQGTLQGIPFIGVYIPTDIQWKRQIEHFENLLKGKPVYSELISKQIVTTNILIALCETFASIIEFMDRKEDILEIEAKLSKELISEWKIPTPTSPTISSIIQSLLRRIKDINALVNRCKHQPDNKVEFPEYFYENYFDLVVIGCFVFKKYFQEDDFFANSTFRWALCFDELEIAPKWLQMDLLDKIRSTNQNIILKLTTSPIVSLVDQLKKDFYKVDGRENEDYKIIRTWTYNETESNKWGIFGSKLIKNKLSRTFDYEIDEHEIFGIDSIDRNLAESFKGSDKNLGSYEKGSIVWQLFLESAKIDVSFRKFLELKGINPINPHPIDKSQEDEIFRKIKPIVTYRYQYRKELGLRRSRRNASLYYGLPFIYKICDGNPRALIGLIDEFLLKGKKNSFGHIQPFYINNQSAIITSVSERYLSLIETHPDSNILHNNRYINLGKILRVIGEFFQKKLLFEDFLMDPYGSFVVDDSVNPKIIELLELAVHLGAIIYLDPSESITSQGIIGKKFRLTYLLHPYFKLPKREYTSVNLGTIINKKGSKILNQKLLFEEEEL